MSRLIRRISKSVGLSPGTLVHIGEKREEKIKISIIDYDEKQFQEKEAKTIEDCFPFKDTPSVSWVNIDGVHDLALIEKFGSYFDLHPLILEDIVDTNQRPKYEDAEKYIFIVLKMFSHQGKDIEVEQMSLILGTNFVVSFQEKEGDIFDPIRERIRTAKGRIRKMGADYLAYILIDAIVDNYFVIMEKMGEKIDEMEEDVIHNPSPRIVQMIHSFKQEVIFLRKSVWPLREVIGGMVRSESKLIKKSTHIFLRDIYDHTIQVIDIIETFRDLLSGMLEVYLSSISNRINEIMKVLTIFAAIFIPLTLISGIYGMNFKYMPGLQWRWGYFFILGVMATVAVSLLLFFKKKKWI